VNRRSHALPFVAVLAAVAVATAAGAQARSKPANPYAARVGFASHTTYMSARDARAYVQRAAGLGVRWLREDFAWSSIEQRKGHFNWGKTDGLMRNAAEARMNIVALVAYAPAWANGGHPDDKYPPLNPRDYADFVLAVAHRYGKGGSFWRQNRKLKQRPLSAIELWNEPWSSTFWKPEPDVTAYAALVRATAPRLKARHARIKILVSGDLQLSYSDSRDYADGTQRDWEHGFLARLLREDFAFRSIDGYAVHPYSQHYDPGATTIPGFADQSLAQQWLYRKVLLIRDLLDRAGRLKPLWSTEVGWSTSGDVDEATQGRYLEEALTLAVDEWNGFIARTFVYVLEKPHNRDYAGGYNLLRDDVTPKDGWLRLRRLLGH
jgi:polysaccharide biosynthesis protein PslG